MVSVVYPEDNLYEIGAEDREEPRFYEIHGVILPSVTTVIGVIRNPFLKRWQGKVGNDQADLVMRETSEYGTMVHDYIALLNITGGDFSTIGTVPDNMKAQLLSYIEWRNNMVREVVAVEETVYSLRYGFAGKVDLVAHLYGDPAASVWDVKTGTLRSISRAQTAAYREAYREMNPKEAVERRGLLGVSRKTGKLTVKEHGDEDDFNGFLYLLNTYNWLASIGEA